MWSFRCANISCCECYVDLRVAGGFDFCSLIDSIYRAIELNLGAPVGEGV
jgi:hypothetical protein